MEDKNDDIDDVDDDGAEGFVAALVDGAIEGVTQVGRLEKILQGAFGCPAMSRTSARSLLQDILPTGSGR